MEDAAVRALVERAQRGDDDAFATLYADLAPRVLRYLRHQVGNPDRAEELMQETFMKVVEALSRFRLRERVPFAAWVFRIARNAVIDDRRSTHPTFELEAASQVVSPAVGPAELAEAASERAALVEALGRLTPEHRDVLVYRFFAELRPPEVAALMGRSDGAVRVLQHRALSALRSVLEESVTAEVPEVAP
jgi:RNA polymerase sigma-70 factor (ECF subfamily)